MVGVQIAYIDESYNQHQSFYYMGAAIADASVWETVSDKMDQVRSRTVVNFDLPEDVEFHGHELMGGQGEWSPLRGKHRAAQAIYRAVLEAADSPDLKYVFTGVDVRRLNARYRYPYPPHVVALTLLLEAIDDRVTVCSKDQCIVVADRNDDMENASARFFELFQQQGTWGYKQSKLSRIDPPLNFADSRQCNELQIADMALYMWQRREIVGTESSPSAQHARDRLLKIVDGQTIVRKVLKP